DWALVGAGPATLDLGFYLFANWRWRGRSGEDTLARYRGLLESGLRERLSDAVWEQLVAVAVVCGAVMDTASLTLLLEQGVPGAVEEWDWRVRRLQRLV